MQLLFSILLSVSFLVATRKKLSVGIITWFWPIAFLIPALFFSYGEITWQLQQSHYSQIAGTETGRSVDVKCKRSSVSMLDVTGYMGFVPYPSTGKPTTAILRADTCKELARYHSNSRNPSTQEIHAVHVLTHEIAHLRGVTDESIAECEAMQRNAITAKLLGANKKDAQKLAKTYWQILYPRVPSNYSNSECKPGGTLDEQLPNPPW